MTAEFQPAKIDPFDDLGRFRLPQDVRENIERAAVEAQRLAAKKRGRGPTERQQVRAFIRGVEYFTAVLVNLRRWFPRDEPCKYELETPLSDIAGAIDTIERAVRHLSRLPGYQDAALDIGLRLMCKARALGPDGWDRHKEDIRARVEAARRGGAVDIYLPEGRNVFGLPWFLDALRSSVNAELAYVSTLTGRPPDGRNAHYVWNVQQEFNDRLHCPPIFTKKGDSPFAKILRELFDHLAKEHHITGKNGNPVSVKTLYKSSTAVPRKAPRACSWSTVSCS